MARAAKRANAGLLLLGLAANTVSARAVGCVFSGARSNATTPQVVPVPDLAGMTTAKAVRTLKAAHLRPLIRFTRHAKGQPSGMIVAAPLGSDPVSVGGGHSVGVASEGDVISLI